jgi:hypothetical protein
MAHICDINVLNPAPPIASLHYDCMQAFSYLFDSLNHDEAREYLPGFREEHGRFIVWAENAGAHRSGRVSLDYRLREASNVKGMVIKLLEDLTSDLRDGTV